jgi:flavin-binding protein dodecin
MSESVYRLTEVIGTSPDSSEAAARNAGKAARALTRTIRRLDPVRRSELEDHV